MERSWCQGGSENPQSAGSVHQGATLSGYVTDADGAAVVGAKVVLNGGRALTTDEHGGYAFQQVPAGAYRVAASMAGFTTGAATGTATDGAAMDVPAIALLAAADTDIEVTASLHDLAAAEVKSEESQRVLGILPNFYVVYDWHAAALTPKQKFGLALHATLDPRTFVINAAIAGVQQATDAFPGYHEGAKGYFKRYGADEADTAVGTLLGGAVFPILFRQDPRYFYMGPTRSKTRRFFYALSTAAICKGDNGKWQPNYSSVLGDLAAGAMSNLYYPASNRSAAGLVIENGLVGAALDGVGNVVQEFLFRHLTPHAPDYPGTTKREP